MAIIDELRGILGEEAIAKIEGNSTLKTKLTRGDELVGLLDDGKIPPELNSTGAGLTLDQLTAQLNTAFTGFETRFAPKIDERVKAVVDPLTAKFTEEIANARRDAANVGYVARELVRIENQHKQTFGEDFNESELNTWVKAQQDAGRTFSNVREAYDAWTGPKVMEKKIAEAREEGKRDAMSSRTVPGVSSPAATGVREKFRAFKNGSQSGQTRTDALDQKLAELDARTARIA